EPRSNTMKLGVWADALGQSLEGADRVFCYSAQLGWDAATALKVLGKRALAIDDLESLVEAVANEARPGDQVLVMSNGSFGGIHDRILKRLAGERATS
ncbi:MAG: UDP-N-acetylmuramate:L-alanyl-gamma-D-glutamyl-meso-diaminopimelate ligase, partial [Betaproteobacteria bacterium]|nr:UDP-N-acetylmuramate:L-alanyl-gamma-D-glutamyl-meso-diaminopimelate ligase [Betaproteobacteria bacterium]